MAFYAYGSQIAGSSPVYRFYNTQTGRHFYTMSTVERDNVIGTAGYNYEGPSWYAQAPSGGTPRRLPLLQQDKAHFYTISAAKRTSWCRDPSWALEGIAYYAWTTQ